MRARPDTARIASAALFAALGLLLLWHAAKLLAYGAWAIGYPYELDYGEGIVWQQMRTMFDGRGYGPIADYPLIVFHYPPVYHALTCAAAHLFGLDGLAAGRIVSLVSLLVAAGFGAAVVRRLLRAEGQGTAATIGALVAAFTMLSNWPILFWTPVMRVDLLALAFSFAGLWCALVALERPRIIYAAASLFVLAVYTKHSMIAAPASCFGALLLLRPATALRGIAASILLGLAALAALGWATNGGFFRHLFLYNLNRFDLRQMMPLVTLFSAHSLYFAVAILGNRERAGRLSAAFRSSQGTMRSRIAALPGGEGLLILSAYLLTTMLMLPLIAKSGSNANYLIEFTSVACLFVGLGVSRAAVLALNGTGSRDRGPRLLSLVLVSALVAQVWLLPTNRFDKVAPRPPRAEFAALEEMIRGAGKPVLSDDMVLLIRAGKDVTWEPAIFAELSAKGLVDEHAFVRRIRAGDFAFFVTYGEPGEPIFDARYNPAVADAMIRAYPRRIDLAGFAVRLPAE